MLKNKIKKIKSKITFSDKPKNKQKTVITVLVFILGLSVLTYLIILNTGIFTTGYSQPFMDWLHTSGGIAFVSTYLVILLILILLSVNKTNKSIGKGVNKLTSPISSRFASSYSTDSMAKRKKRIKILMWVLIILTPLVVFTFINQDYAQAGWWNDNWSYRKRVTISNAGAEQTDYQVDITLNTSSLISAGKMQSDCDDIRILDYSTGKPITEPYWVESCNTSSTKVWVKFATVPTSDLVFYLYYGNNQAPNLQSSGDDVFLFFDDFNDSSIDTSKWSTAGSTTESGGIVTLDNDGTTPRLYTHTAFSFSEPFITEAKYQHPSRYRNRLYLTTSQLGGIPTGYDYGIYDSSIYWNGFTGVNLSINTWYIVQWIETSSNYTWKILNLNRSEVISRSYGSDISNASYLDFSGTEGTNSDFKLDHVLVRKYASTEPSTTLASEEVGPQPLAYWKFDEGYGQTANDSSPSKNDATLGSTAGSDTNDPAWLTEDDCVSGKCLSFDGIDNYVNPNNQLLSGTKYSVSAWFKTSTINQTMVIYDQRSSTDGDSIMGQLYLWGSNITFITRADNGGNSALARGSTSLENNTWYHVVGVRDGANVYVYLNGELETSDNDAGGTITTNVSDIGRYNAGGTLGGYFNGSIDEIKVYPYARGADEIKTDYIGGSSSGSSAVLGRSADEVLKKGLVTHWKMDETSANSCDDTNDACDSTGNLNHARWEDNATSTSGKFAQAVDFDGTNDRVATSSANTVPGLSTADNWFDQEWINRKSITFDNSDSTEDLNEFPILVKLNSSRIDYSKTQNSGQDIRFTDADGTSILAHEIEKWDEAGTSWVWVKVPNIPTGSTTDYIWMYYDNSSVSDGQNATAVWNSDYKMIQHMEETSGTNMTDSRSNPMNGTKLSDTQPNPTASGKIGGAQYFDGSNDYINFNTYNFGDTFTISTWINPTNDSNSMIFFSNRGTGATTNGFLAYTGTWTSGDGKVIFEAPNGSTGGGATTSAGVLNYGSWNYVTFVINRAGNNGKIYHNGVKVSTGEWIHNDFMVNSDWEIGRPENGIYTFTGSLDEFRVTNTLSTADWIEAEYKSMNDTFISSFGSEETGQNQLTLSAWIKADTLGATDRVIIARNNSGSYSWAIYNDSANPGKLAFTSDGETTTGVSDSTLSTGNWYHVAMTVINNTTRLYINGVLDKEIDSNGTLPGTGDISVGADPDGTDGWDGKIDEVRIYSRTLDAGTVEELYKWAPKPLAFYNFEEGEGTTTVYDKSGNEFNGTMNGSMTEDDWVQGKVGKALDFDGSDDYIDTVDDPFDFTNNFSVSAWTYYDQNTQHNVIAGNLDYSGNTGWIFRSEKISMGDGWSFFIGNTECESTDGTMDLNTWIHTAVVFENDRDIVTFYKNGVQNGQCTSYTKSPTANTYNMFIGDEPGNPVLKMDGKIDELKIYDYARTQEQIIQDINAGHPAPGSPVGSSMMHLRFDEGYGDTANDSSPQGNDGDLNGTCPGAGTCPAWTNSGKISKGLSFDGGDYLANSLSPSLANNSFTISGWVKADNLSANRTWFSLGTSATSYNAMHLRMYTDGMIRMGFYNDDLDTSSGTFTAGVWHYVAYTFNSDTKHRVIYVDGIEKASDDTSGNFTGNNSLNVGRLVASGTEYWLGQVDEVKIYNFDLSPSQILQDMNQGKSVVWGATSTDSLGNADRSAERKYCVPGDSTSCSAPIAEWKLDEGQGTSAYDTSENNNTGTLTSGPTWGFLRECPDGKCIKYDGSDDYVTIADHSSLDITGSVTLESWVKIDSIPDALVPIIVKRRDTGSCSASGDLINYMMTVSSTNQLSFTYRDSGGGSHGFQETTGSVSAGQWHHVAFSYTFGTASSAKLYVDGQEQAGSWAFGTGSSSGSSNNYPLHLGRDYYCVSEDVRYIDGSIDNPRVFNYALSPSQIAWNFNQGEPIGHWKLNECQGGTAYDSGSGGNNGTITIGGTGDNQTLGTCSSGTGTEAWNNGTTGKRNASLDLDGTDDRSDTSAVSDFNLTGSDFTVSAWIKTSQSSLGSYLAIRDTSGGGSGILAVFPLNVTSGKVSLDTWDYASSRVTSNTTVNDGQWHHIVATYDSSTGLASLYVDGKFDNSDTQSGSAPNVSKMVRLGGNISPGGGMLQPYDGQIDEAKVFNYKLTQQQILTVFREGAVRF